ncbi:hypothetical protein BaRGS_00017689 [Batillaria attramentaria]|uniref:Band 7 domain-containing protein n=1 Tax=Batillaria attramentaria TaxID=370345 RepID=A0ABD0KV67_9CAEN
MKFKTVREGQQAVILNHLGEGELVVGPKRVFLFRKRFSLLTHYSAASDEYLAVQEKDGTVYHKPGPCELFNNPLLYEYVRVQKAIRLDAHILIVIYKRLSNGNVERRIVEGPAVVIPEAEEWLHEFVWHGTDPVNKARMVPGQRRFTQLAVIPDHFYYNVREVRTNDDTMITVKVMVFYVVVEILKMLDTTHDPIADIINALCADVISFVSKLSYVQFVEETAKLSSMDTYPHLKQRMERIGVRVDKVVYRGYHASDQMQEMQNSAIESRTRLRLQGEMEEMQQNLTNLKLNKEEARAGLKKQMEAGRWQHKQRTEQMKQQHDLEQQQLQHTQRLELRSLDTAARLKREKEEDERKLDFLTRLSELDVNVTEYLVSQQDPPPAKQIQFTTV